MPRFTSVAVQWKWRGAKRVHTKARDYFNMRVILALIDNAEIDLRSSGCKGSKA